MRLLIVEGNTEKTRIERGTFGIKPYHITFQEMLKGLVPKAVTEVAFPADKETILPSIQKLKTYEGVLWTGSSLSVLDNILAVQQQLDFAETVFKSGLPFYGSCWGLQVATVVAGGKVAKGKNGLELASSKLISLTDEGKKSPFLKYRKTPYKSLCIHYDEVAELPKNTEVLAYNEHSKVQAMTFNYLNSRFFGVQYHPEFKTSEMALIISFLKEKLIDNNYFPSEEEANNLIDSLNNKEGLKEEISNYKLHTQEIKAWLDYISKTKNIE